uniref:Uncharacterized protein n=1 Tax=Steinernema glaseri TaxID=37863 RepID=A0A1I7YDW3_9BILA
MELFLLRLFLFALVISLIQGRPLFFSDYWNSFYGYGSTPGGYAYGTDYPTPSQYGDPYGQYATGSGGGCTPGPDGSYSTPYWGYPYGQYYTGSYGGYTPFPDASNTDYNTPYGGYPYGQYASDSYGQPTPGGEPSATGYPTPFYYGYTY